MKKCTTCLALFFTNLLCAAELNNLYQTIVLSQPVKKVVSQLQSDGTTSYSSRIDPVTSRISDDGSYCISRTKDGVTEVYDINSNASQLFRIRADFKPEWAPSLNKSGMLLTPGAQPDHISVVPVYRTENRQTIMCQGAISDVVPDLDNRIFSLFTANYKYESEDACLLMYDLGEQRAQSFNLGIIITHHVRSHLAVHQTDSLIAYGDQSRAYIYDLKSGTCVHTCCSGGYDVRAGTSVNQSDVVDLDFNSAKKRLAFCNLYGQVYEIDLRFTKKYLHKMYDGHGGYSVSYDKTGNQLLVGRSDRIHINDAQGSTQHEIIVNNTGNIISLFCDAQKDTWHASTTRNTLLKGAISALERKKEHDALEAQRRAGYDQLMEQFYLLFYQKSEAERGADQVEWTTQDQENYQELERTLRSMGQELGINDFW